MACPSHQLVATRAGGRTWNVSGCGRTAQFNCWSAPYVGFRCTQATPTVAASPPAQVAYAPTAQVQVQVQAAPAPQPTYVAAAPAGPRPWSPELGRQIYAQVSPRAIACVPPPTPIVLTVEYQLDGRAARVTGLEAFSPAQQACLQAAVQSVSVPGGLTQAVAVPFQLR